jgi:hypothetical protein
MAFFGGYVLVAEASVRGDYGHEMQSALGWYTYGRNNWKDEGLVGEK